MSYYQSNGWHCWSCGLPDYYDGAGDGIGSCECPRCEWCSGPPLECSCEDDDYYDGEWRPEDDDYGQWAEAYEEYLNGAMG